MQRPEDDDLILEPGGVGPGRPFIGPKIAVRLSPEYVAQLDRFAEESGLTRSELIRSAVGWYIAANLRPPQDREHDLLRSEIEAQAEARGLSPAALLGVGYGSVLARRGGGK